MRINVSLKVGEEVVKEDVIEIDDSKLEELSDDEVDASIEVLIRTWADRHVHIAWEVDSK